MDDRFTPGIGLICDCGVDTFGVQLGDDDALQVVCRGCGGNALLLDVWEERNDDEEPT